MLISWLDTQTKFKSILVTVAITLPIYYLVQQLTHGRAVLGPLMGIDQYIPLVSSAVWVYTTHIPFLLLSSFFIKDNYNFRVASLSIVVSVALANVSYLVYPAYYPRPLMDPNTLSGLILTAIHIIDLPNNTIPSLHVATSFCMAIALYMSRKDYISYFGILWAISISVSTMLVKQHFFLDVVTGILTAGISTFLVTLYLKRR